MNVELNYEQSSRLELIALQAGKPSAQILIEAAQYLFEREASNVSARKAQTQKFLSEQQLEARFEKILRHRAESHV